MMRTYVVRVVVEVTAKSPEQAREYAVDDLRDPSLPWSNLQMEVQQIDGPHAPVKLGLCPVCGHYGEDCHGEPRKDESAL
jgi:hypothetical protein